MSLRVSRRFCLGMVAGAVTCRQALAVGPSRIASLEWTATEMLLALGAVPVGAGDVPDYGNWVVEPPLPKTVKDLGSRFEPNREVLHFLKPDLILVTEGYGFTKADWEDVAPAHEVVPLAPNGKNPIVHAQDEIRRLGARIGRQAEAEQIIDAADMTFQRARLRLADAARAPICIVTILEERSVRIYGGGLVHAVLARLGLTNAWTGETGRWGFGQIGIETLASLPRDTRMILLDPIPDAVRIRLEQSSLWPNLPVVRAGGVRPMPPVWPFGGLTSAARCARLLAETLGRD